jgi:hypothetical protein
LPFFSANSNYELGRGDKVGGWRPKPIPSLEDVRIIQIAGGGYHCLALTGKVTPKLNDYSHNCNFFSFFFFILASF